MVDTLDFHPILSPGVVLQKKKKNKNCIVGQFERDNGGCLLWVGVGSAWSIVGKMPKFSEISVKFFCLAMLSIAEGHVKCAKTEASTSGLKGLLTRLPHALSPCKARKMAFSMRGKNWPLAYWR